MGSIELPALLHGDRHAPGGPDALTGYALPSDISAAVAGLATSADVTTAVNSAVTSLTAMINALKGSPPSGLDTLQELAAAINNDPSYHTTVDNALALKASLPTSFVANSYLKSGATTSDPLTWGTPSTGGSAAQAGLPSWVTVSLLKQWSQRDSSYNVGTSLVGLYGGLIKTDAAIADTHILGLGDDLLNGYTGGSYVYGDNVLRSAVKQVARARNLNFSNGIQMLISDMTPNSADNVQAQAWTKQVNPFPAMVSTASGQTGAQVQMPDLFTDLDVFVDNSSPSGLIPVVDNADQAPITTTGTPGIIKVTVVSGMTPKARTVKFRSTAAGQIVIAVWGRTTNIFTKTVYAHNLTLGGSFANMGSMYQNWSDPTTGATPGLGGFMRALLTAIGITPTHTLLSLGWNDLANSATVAATINAINNILNSSWWGIRSYLHPYKPISSLADSTWNDFSNQMFTSCDSHDIAMFDLDYWISRLSNAAAMGVLGTDGQHPIQPFQKAIGAMIGKMWCHGLWSPQTIQTLLEVSGVYPTRNDLNRVPPGNAIYEGHDNPGLLYANDLWIQTA